MRLAPSKKYEAVLLELAQDHGSPVGLDVFERVLGISLEGVKKAKPDNQRQAFKRFHDWCAFFGLSFEKVIERDEPVVIVYSPQEAIALSKRLTAKRLHKRLSRRPCISSDEKGRPGMSEGTELRRGDEKALDSKGVAKALGVSVKHARWLMSSGDLRVFKVGGCRRTWPSWVRAYTETQGAKK